MHWQSEPCLEGRPPLAKPRQYWTWRGGEHKEYHSSPSRVVRCTLGLFPTTGGKNWTLQTPIQNPLVVMGDRIPLWKYYCQGVAIRFRWKKSDSPATKVSKREPLFCRYHHSTHIAWPPGPAISCIATPGLRSKRLGSQVHPYKLQYTKDLIPLLQHLYPKTQWAMIVYLRRIKTFMSR